MGMSCLEKRISKQEKEGDQILPGCPQRESHFKTSRRDVLYSPSGVLKEKGSLLGVEKGMKRSRGKHSIFLWEVSRLKYKHLLVLQDIVKRVKKRTDTEVGGPGGLGKLRKSRSLLNTSGSESA